MAGNGVITVRARIRRPARCREFMHQSRSFGLKGSDLVRADTVSRICVHAAAVSDHQLADIEGDQANKVRNTLTPSISRSSRARSFLSSCIVYPGPPQARRLVRKEACRVFARTTSRFLHLFLMLRRLWTCWICSSHWRSSVRALEIWSIALIDEFALIASLCNRMGFAA